MTQTQKNAVIYFLVCFEHYQKCSSPSTRVFCRDQMAAARDEFIGIGGTWPQLVYEVEARFGASVAKDWQE